jgi:hypothetical protein
MAIGIEADLFFPEPLVQKKRESKSHFANQIMMTFFLHHFVLLVFFSADMLPFFAKAHNKTGN